MKKVGQDLKNDETLGPMMLEDPDIFGVDQFADSAVIIIMERTKRKLNGFAFRMGYNPVQ